MEIAVILAVVVVAANIVLIRYIKKNHPGHPGVSSDLDSESHVFSKGYLNTPEVKKLKESAAAQLGVSMKELDQILAKELEKIGSEKKTTDIH